jgi:succinate dehydrogenase/fumarate reductase flavoprotein subunit
MHGPSPFLSAPSFAAVISSAARQLRSLRSIAVSHPTRSPQPSSAITSTQGKARTRNSAVDRPLHQGPNPCVAPIENGPFYAVKVFPGSFGTFAGLKTNGSAQALDHHDKPIPGLYAVGTDMASVMGGFYPSGGINLGPAMTFGYVAGRHAAGATKYEDDDAAGTGDGTSQAAARVPIPTH